MGFPCDLYLIGQTENVKKFRPCKYVQMNLFPVNFGQTLFLLGSLQLFACHLNLSSNRTHLQMGRTRSGGRHFHSFNSVGFNQAPNLQRPFSLSHSLIHLETFLKLYRIISQVGFQCTLCRLRLSRSPFCGPDAIECLGSSQEWDGQ